MKFAEYDYLLEVWLSKVPEIRLKSNNELVHPRALEIEAFARSQIEVLHNATGLDITLGGSCLSYEERSALLNGQNPDLDIRIWIREPADFGRVETAILSLFPNCQKQDKSDRAEIFKTGLPAYAYVVILPDNGINYRLEILVRAEGKHGKHPLAVKRLKTLTDIQFSKYLNLKAHLKANTEQYRAFKATEISFWTRDEKLISALERIHQKTVGQKLRKSEKGAITHSKHMRNVAFRSLALGTDESDFVTAYLHDVLEEGVAAHSIESLQNIIREELIGFLDAVQVSEVIQRIQLLTEEKLNERELFSIKPELSRLIEQIAANERESLKQSEVDYLIWYFKKYQKFLRTLIRESARIRLVELADRWDGLLDMSYMEKYSVTQRHISFGRIGATLEVMQGSNYPVIMDAYVAAYRSFGLDKEYIDAAAKLFIQSW